MSRVHPGIRLLLPLGLVVGALMLTSAARKLESFSTSPYPVVRSFSFQGAQLALVSRTDSVREGVVAEALPMRQHLQPGETLSEVLEDWGLNAGEVHSAAGALAEHLDPRRLRSGDTYTAHVDEGQILRAFEWELEAKGRVILSRHEDTWISSWQPFERRLRRQHIRGTLEDSLERSIRHAGGEAMLAYRMADVLQWDLDFNRDLQPGDTFQLVYDKIFLDGELYGAGDIHGLVYVNAGRRLEAYRFESNHVVGYYDAEGRPLRKMFLRSPLSYSRVTSRFSHKRFHPILKRYRPHYGVDYGAPRGTPVRVTANGKVIFAGRNGGGGNTIKVRHPNGYVTAYLHLSKFAKGIRTGARVGQGDVIAYVGTTGLSTAPHLDYRVQVKGRWIDPLSIKSVPAEPIAGAQMAEFERLRDQLRNVLTPV